MQQGESELLDESLRVFGEKKARFRQACAGNDIEQYYERLLEKAEKPEVALWQPGKVVRAEDALKDRLAVLPEKMRPVVICGGSFSSSARRAAVRKEDRELIDGLLEKADPDEVFFVVGHTLLGQEGYLVRQAAGRFRVFAIVPGMLTRAAAEALRAAGVGILISIENSGLGLYKSVSYEVFRNRPSVLLAFDGNSAALNLIQQARNSSNRHRIYISPRSRELTEKAKMLEGYVRPMPGAEEILRP